MGQFIDDPEVQPSSDGSPVFVSMRNQLTLIITPSILVFRDESGETPSREDFPKRVAQVALHVARMSQLRYVKVGMRFDVESKQERGELPSKIMLRRFVSREALAGLGYDVVGAAARVWYMARNSLHSLHIEPKEDDHDSPEYTAHLIAEIELESAFPSAEWIRHTLIEEYLDFLKVLGKMLGSKEG